ncbi:MBOAT family protein [Candidatus Sumerlaeota bacterium]|nr:MBOAT family protein [Candidatus Sumerlaeota bacterium]
MSQLPRRRLWLAFSVIANLGVLAFFKYQGFFVTNFMDLMSIFGWKIHVAVPQFVLPVGISFYTFQSMSYTIDVYRGDTEPCVPDFTIRNLWKRLLSVAESLIDFALFVSFFPQLVAGPIERSSRLLRQIRMPRKITAERIGDGCWFFLLGLVMKIGVADEISPYVDEIFTRLAAATPLRVYCATAGFAIQIYCDFAGYTYMARGLANFMGFELMANFRFPYLASSFADFWKRWHISLSTWIRDYLYIPLGGNRGSKPATAFNLMLSMLLAGLWHGASNAFLVWGAIHGTFLVLERIYNWTAAANAPRSPAQSSIWRVTKRIAYHLLVLQVVLLGWFFFRAGYLQGLGGIIAGLVNGPTWGSWSDLPLRLPDSLGFIFFGIIFLLHDVPCWWADRELKPRDFSRLRRFILYIALFGILIASGGEKDAPFIYFQF